MTLLIRTSDFSSWIASVAGASERTKHTFAQFFFAEIENPHTRRAYLRGAIDFFHFVALQPAIDHLRILTSLHVAAWVADMKGRRLAIPTIKQRLAGLRMLCRALVREQTLIVDPTAVVRSPKHSVSTGKTPALDGDQVHKLLSSIDPTTLMGLRDRAIIATMAYSFARVSAVCALKRADVFWQKKRLWLRLNEKGGKTKDIPCHPVLQGYLIDWMTATEKDASAGSPLLPTFAWQGREQRPAIDPAAPVTPCKRMRVPTNRPMTQAMTWQMLQRRASTAGIETAVCNHSFRAAGITAYLKNGGTIERAAHIAGHASTRTTQLYDRRPDDVTLDEIEKIRFG